jgi:hypothetical protein
MLLPLVPPHSQEQWAHDCPRPMPHHPFHQEQCPQAHGLPYQTHCCQQPLADTHLLEPPQYPPYLGVSPSSPPFWRIVTTLIVCSSSMSLRQAGAQIQNAATLVIRVNEVSFQVFRLGFGFAHTDPLKVFHAMTRFSATKAIPFPVPCLALAMLPSPSTLLGASEGLTLQPHNDGAHEREDPKH